MKKYIFKVGEAIFIRTPDTVYNEVEHKILNDKIRDIEFTLRAQNIDGAIAKINDQLLEIAKCDLTSFSNIKNYKFEPILIKIIEISE